MTTSRQPLLTVDQVSIHAPGSSDTSQHKVLVDSVSCHLDAGEILSVIGPNGAGKSSLLKAIAGDLPFDGNITINGISADPKLRARQLAVLPQLSLLNFPYRVCEVVGLSRIPHSTGQQRDAEIIQQALELMDIDFLKNRLYTELSGGERQRVQLARVFAQIWDAEHADQGARLLLLDEPTAALDLGHQQQLMQAIKSFAEQGVAVFMVLHDINLAAHHTNRMLALLCSQRIAYGSPDEVVTQDNVRRLFGIDTQVINHPEHNTPIVIGH